MSEIPKESRERALKFAGDMYQAATWSAAEVVQNLAYTPTTAQFQRLKDNIEDRIIALVKEALQNNWNPPFLLLKVKDMGRVVAQQVLTS